MYTSITGTYRNGNVVLSEQPQRIEEETKVIVTFLSDYDVDLRARGIDQEQAAELLSGLASFANDWNLPEMDIYDDYDTAITAR